MKQSSFQQSYVYTSKHFSLVPIVTGNELLAYAIGNRKNVKSYPKKNESRHTCIPERQGWDLLHPVVECQLHQGGPNHRLHTVDCDHPVHKTENKTVLISTQEHVYV